MSPALTKFVEIDFPPLLAAVFSALVCGLLGNWLVLRRMSLMGDAISHAVLPGIVIAFMISGSRAPLPMFIGALAAGGATALLTGVVRRLARVDVGAAMAVVFASLFALGVLLIEQAARQVDLDPDCVLYGSLETLNWYLPREGYSLGLLLDLPTPVLTLAGVFAVSAVALWALRKELAIASFDPLLAAALGFRPALLTGILMLLVASATIASFEAVGSILVVATLICPAAAARMWTDRLRRQIALSAIFAVTAALVGYLAAATAPRWLGTTHALGAAGTIATVCGAILTLSIFASPTHGVIAAAIRRRALAIRVAREDALGLLYRLLEAGTRDAPEAAVLASIGHDRLGSVGLREAIRRAELERNGDRVHLTQRGAEEARAIIRSHRLWESYLVEEAGIAPDHVHDPAETLEHVSVVPVADRARDPHGKAIP